MTDITKTPEMAQANLILTDALRAYVLAERALNRALRSGTDAEIQAAQTEYAKCQDAYTLARLGVTTQGNAEYVPTRKRGSK